MSADDEEWYRTIRASLLSSRPKNAENIALNRCFRLLPGYHYHVRAAREGFQERIKRKWK